MSKPILPGATIGVLGGGQLGRMFAIAARRMGYRVHTYSPDRDTPTGQVSDLEVVNDYRDLDAVMEFARGVDVVTFEFENVPDITANACAANAPVRPSGSVLHTTQHRLREKNFLRRSGLPVTEFMAVSSRAELHGAIDKVGLPAILKTADFGYDGKGQCRIDRLEHADAAYDSLDRRTCVLEAVVDFQCELSVVAARDESGEFVHYGPVLNQHSRGILDVTVAPAVLSAAVTNSAVEIAREVLEKLDVVGVLCVEFFLDRRDRLIINELAPRPHNSGHFTFDACVTSQFEQQLRAVCNLPLGSTKQMVPAAMANLLGDVWRDGEPDWMAALHNQDVKLHLYGKSEPREGRKMGHLTALGEGALENVLAARKALLQPLTEGAAR